jgi:putative flippase GtrA
MMASSSPIAEEIHSELLFEGIQLNDFNDCDDIHETDTLTDSLYPLKMQHVSAFNNSGMMNVGLRERTTSQSSVEQLEAPPASSSFGNSSNTMNNSRRANRTIYRNNISLVSPTSLHRPKYTGTVPLHRIPDYSTNSTSTTAPTAQPRLRWIVETIQSVQVPPGIVRYCRKRPKLSNATDMNDDTVSDSPVEMHDSIVYWITGLDRVLFTKASCCAEDIRIVGWKPPRYLWYMISGAICDVVQLGLLYLLHVKIRDSTTCWVIAFSTSIVFRHTSHRYFVFGDYVGGYRKSLIRMYAGYSVTIVLSTIFNFILSRVLEVSLFSLAILTMAWTGAANYFILKYFWNIGSTAVQHDHNGVNGSNINNSTTGSESLSGTN